MPAGVGLEVLVAIVLMGCLVGAVFAGRRLREIPMPDVRPRRERLPSRLRALSEQERPTDADWRWLEDGLARAGAGRTAAREVVTRVRERHEPPQDPGPLLVEEVAGMFAEDPGFGLPATRPAIILMVGPGRGVPGASVGQMAHRLAGENRTVAVAAVDADRAKDVSAWAQRGGAEPLTLPASGPRVAAAVRAAGDRDVLILVGGRARRGQTPGSPADVRRAVQAVAGRPPDVVLLVLDATTALHTLPQAREIAQAAGARGLMLAGMELPANRAAALSVREALGLPVWFVGKGGQVEDLEPLEPRAYADSLLQ